jgi:hypothetical protein
LGGGIDSKESRTAKAKQETTWMLVRMDFSWRRRSYVSPLFSASFLQEATETRSSPPVLFDTGAENINDPPAV